MRHQGGLGCPWCGRVGACGRDSAGGARTSVCIFGLASLVGLVCRWLVLIPNPGGGCVAGDAFVVFGHDVARSMGMVGRGATGIGGGFGQLLVGSFARSG